MTTRVFGALMPAALLLSGGSAPSAQKADVPTSTTGQVQWQYDAGG
jgi:hypothetical protein